MLNLYRTTNGLTEYWEAWEDTRTKVVVHWGALGEKGNTRKVSHHASLSSSAVIEKEAEPIKAAGFKPVNIEEHTQIVIQYKVEGRGSSKDHDRRVKVEDRMNDCLGWTGLGHCDGGDLGSGTMNVFCEVVNRAIAEPIIIADLREYGFLEGAVLARRDRAGNEEYSVFWPDGFRGGFNLI